MVWTSVDLFTHFFSSFVVKNAACQLLGFEDDKNLVTRVYILYI